MIAFEVLADLRHRGVELFVAGGILRYRAPRGVLTPELRAALSAHKVELLSLLMGSGTGGRLDPADCLELLTEMHASNRADYPAGALSLLDADAELCWRFHATEARIDELAKVAGGPTEADFRRALADHAAVWREISQRYRARQERRAHPMPHLPDDTVLAIGVGYGDGEPARRWGVIREGRQR